MTEDLLKRCTERYPLVLEKLPECEGSDNENEGEGEAPVKSEDSASEEVVPEAAGPPPPPPSQGVAVAGPSTNP